MDYNLDKLEYHMFISEQIVEQSYLEKYVNECLMMGEGTNSLSNMKILNEGFVDTIKTVIAKIMTGIAKMWNGFLEATNTLLKTDKNYLEKYKDTITKKNATDATFTMYDYNKGGLDKIIRATVPSFNYNEMKQYLDTDENFQNKYFGNYMQGKPEDAFSDRIKTAFRGSAEEIEIKASQLNMTDLYNYCYNYHNLVTNIEKDTKTIEAAGVAAVKVIDDMVKNNTIQREAVNIFENGEYFSDIYQTFITEKVGITPGPAAAKADVPKTGEDGKSEAAKTDETNPAKANKNIDDGKPDSNDKEIQDKAKSGDGIEKTAKENTERINRYLRICGIFLGAKLSIAQGIYKDYMSIMKFHVRQHLGDKTDATTSKAADTASGYNGDGNTKDTPETKPAEEAKAKTKDTEDKKKLNGTLKDKVANAFKAFTKPA